MGCSRAVFARAAADQRRTLEKWERGRPSRILRRQRWFCWCAGIPTRWSGWKGWRLVDAMGKWSQKIAKRKTSLMLRMNGELGK
jgi:hypothetical protein